MFQPAVAQSRSCYVRCTTRRCARPCRARSLKDSSVERTRWPLWPPRSTCRSLFFSRSHNEAATTAVLLTLFAFLPCAAQHKPFPRAAASILDLTGALRASPLVTPIRAPARPVFGPYGGRRREIGNRGRRLLSRAPQSKQIF
jgi:hypothetical protein